MSKLRDESGNIVDSSKLVAFLYELMRDELPPGKIETLVQNSEDTDIETKCHFTNGYLAKYAQHLAKRLRD